jgi:hypothetical protein
VSEQVTPSGNSAFGQVATDFAMFDTEAHYLQVAAEIRATLAEGGGFALVSGTPPPSGPRLARALSDAALSCHATLIECHPGLSFEAIVRMYAAAFGIRLPPGDAHQQWTLLATMMRPRKGVLYAALLDHAERLDDDVLEDLARTAGPASGAPMVLVGTETLAQRIEDSARASVRAALRRHRRFRELATDEVAAFIRFQTDRFSGPHREVFTPEVIQLIAARAGGDPVIVNRLAHSILDATRGINPTLLAGLRIRGIREDAGGDTEIDLGLALRSSAARRVEAGVPASPPRLSESPPLRVEPSAERGAGSAAAASPSIEPAESVAASLPPRDAYRTRARRFRRSAPMVRAVTAVAAVIMVLGMAFGARQLVLYVSGPQGLERWKLVFAGAQRAPTVPIAREADQTAPGQAGTGAETTVALTPSTPADALPAGLPAIPHGDVATAPAIVPSEPPQAPATAAAAASVGEAPAQHDTAPQALAALEPSAGTPSQPAASAAPPGASDAAPSLAALPKSEDGNPPKDDRAMPAVSPSLGAATAETAILVNRGEQMLASGDIVGARQFFERAVARGDAAGACGIGKTYDPLVLRQLPVIGFAPDPRRAAGWYKRAADAGSREASQLLERLEAAFPS